MTDESTENESEKDERVPLRRLFTEPERAEKEVKRQPKEKEVTYAKVMNEAKSLGYPLGRVLTETYAIGGGTIEEISDGVDMEASRVQNAMDELRLQGYTVYNKKDGRKVYFVDDMWGSEDFPSGPIIPLVYQYNLLSDEQRVSEIRSAIEATVESGDVVADLGAGAGILSYLASKEAEQVYSVEVDTEVYERGKELLRDQGVDNVEYIKGDAQNISLPEKVDVVMCEMLDTALAAELQVPVMNHAVENLLKEGGVTIPHRAKTTARLVESDYDFCGGSFRLPHFEAYGSRESINRSQEVEYHEVSFEEKNDLLVDETMKMTVSRDGIVNGIQLNTYTQFARGVKYTSPSEWLNPPLTLPTEENIYLEEGEEVRIDLNYELAGGLSSIEYRTDKM